MLLESSFTEADEEKRQIIIMVRSLCFVHILYGTLCIVSNLQ